MEHKDKVTIAITDFSVSPGPRYISQGEDSGERFYHDVLNPVFTEIFNSNQQLQVVLDGADGYASSFLDEAFGNLVFDFGQNIVSDKVEIVSCEEPEWIEMIEKSTYPQWQKRRENNSKPRVTFDHSEWTRIENDELKKGIWSKK